MNERIRELAIQSGLPTALDYHQKRYEKFAELIVRECIDICEGVAADATATANSKMVTDEGRILHQGMYGGAKSCGGIIKKHFGVEE